jgi:hypothetical protein
VFCCLFVVINQLLVQFALMLLTILMHIPVLPSSVHFLILLAPIGCVRSASSASKPLFIGAFAYHWHGSGGKRFERAVRAVCLRRCFSLSVCLLLSIGFGMVWLLVLSAS